jgi:hypothetical protein
MLGKSKTAPAKFRVRSQGARKDVGRIGELCEEARQKEI